MIKMTTKDLANLIFPNITKTIEDYEKEYPERDLPEGAKVTRYAPSPTGFMHIGNFMSATINYVMAKKSNGVFYLRNEDTDSAREIEGAVEYIRHVLQHYDLNPDEYEYRDTNETAGNYGPYIQSERLPMYKKYADELVDLGGAHYCFCSEEDIQKQRDLAAEHGEAFKFMDPCHAISKEDARARIRVNIRRLLIKYNYPPIKREGAVEQVIRQAELKYSNN